MDKGLAGMHSMHRQQQTTPLAGTHERAQTTTMHKGLAGMHSMHSRQWTTPLAGTHKRAQTTMNKGPASMHKHAQMTTDNPTSSFAERKVSGTFFICPAIRLGTR